MPGEPFFVDPEQNHGYLRLNFSHVAPERLGEGLQRLTRVIRAAQQKQLAEQPEAAVLG